MGGNSFGTIFRITTYGESHGPALGVTIDGFPAGIEVNKELINQDLQRRKPGQSKIVTQRKEDEDFEILSGVFEGYTTGTPISVIIRNKDHKSKDYDHIATSFRPSHADFTYSEKYGIRDYKGGGRSSARETAARVIAGAFAKMLLSKFGIEVIAYVSRVGHLYMEPDMNPIIENIENNIVRCPDATLALEMIEYIQTIKKEGNTVGGIITCVIKNVPAGLGEPVFDKLHADLGKAMLSINAVKGFEYGSGFKSAEMKGSDHNDVFVKSDSGKVETSTNFSGGVQGGISNGMPVYMNIAFKPVATIIRDQSSINQEGEQVTIKGKGRHDPCVVPRAVPIVEAMAAIVLADHLLRKQSDKISRIQV